MASRRKRVLVVGANGFIGRALTSRLVSLGYHVVAASHSQCHGISASQIRTGDLRDARYCRRITRDVDII